MCVCVHMYIHIYVCVCVCVCVGFPGGSMVKNPPANAGDARDEGSIPVGIKQEVGKISWRTK